MGEHMMSHYIDMFAGDAHPGTLHGEQVGVTTLSMSRLQNRILGKHSPPILSPTNIDVAGMVARYGKEIGQNCIKQLKRKALDRKKADEFNLFLEENWEGLSARLRDVMLPSERLWQAMEKIGAPKTAAELGLSQDFYREVVIHSREIRDRYTMLDFAGDSDMLEAFAGEHR
jgi:glycerol-1-phosphate dehydrogenase [NAD(P)+]